MTLAFNLSQLANRVNTSGQLNAATGLFNQVPVANGGTGVSTVTTGALLLGAGTSAMTELTGTTPGTTVVSSPTGWVAAPAASVAGGDYVGRTYTSPNVWTKPATLKAVKVTVVGGGGNGGSSPGAPAPTSSAGYSGGGGGGGAAILYLDAPAIPGSPITITAGPGTNSFGGLASATVGSVGGNSSKPGVAGVGGAGGTGNVPSPAPSGAITFTGVSGVPGGNGLRSVGGSSQLFYAAPLLEVGPITSGTPNPFYGGGGPGAGNNTAGSPTKTGGTGGPGVGIVEEFY
jgi:hypothetical protein